MTSKNEHTGEKQQTKPASETYRDNYDKIFRTKIGDRYIPPYEKTPKEYKIVAETIPVETK